MLTIVKFLLDFYCRLVNSTSNTVYTYVPRFTILHQFDIEPKDDINLIEIFIINIKITMTKSKTIKTPIGIRHRPFIDFDSTNISGWIVNRGVNSLCLQCKMRNILLNAPIGKYNAINNSGNEKLIIYRLLVCECNFKVPSRVNLSCARCKSIFQKKNV